jgi:hypothetical protein
MSAFRWVTAIVLLACSILLASAAPPQDSTGTADAPLDALAANQIEQKLLNQVRDGFEVHNSRKMLAAFDREGMPGYLAFQDQMEAFFSQYESFRASVRLEGSSFEQDKLTATAIFKLEGVPRSGGPAMRREAELTFEFSRSGSGWKIRDVSPRNFFS